MSLLVVVSDAGREQAAVGVVAAVQRGLKRRSFAR
jgi:hypothetical protein